MNRNDIIQKIANLRALGTNNTSEAEAMAALGKAERLMHSYRVDEAELALAEASGEVTFEIIEQETAPLTVGRSGRTRHKVQSCLHAIKIFTETECVIRGGSKEAAFVGDRPDVEMAIYLTELIRDAMDREYQNWRREQPSVGSGAKGTFQLAMGDRVSSRLFQMVREREEKVKALALPSDHVRSELTSTALVVASINEEKKKEVHSQFVAKYPRLRSASGFSCRGGVSAYQAGKNAGDRVNFGRPVDSERTRLIA